MNLALILLEHPSEIARHEKEVLGIEKEIALHQFQLLRIENEIDQSVYFDRDLKNEGQREVRKTETRLEHPGWEHHTEQIAELKQKRSAIRIQIDELVRTYNAALAIQRSAIPSSV